MKRLHEHVFILGSLIPRLREPNETNANNSKIGVSFQDLIEYIMNREYRKPSLNVPWVNSCKILLKLAYLEETVN